MISTAKEGFLQKQSTVISDFSNGMQNRRHVAKVAYAPYLSSKERLVIHDAIVRYFEVSATKGIPLGQTLKWLSDELMPLGGCLMLF